MDDIPMIKDKDEDGHAVFEDDSQKRQDIFDTSKDKISKPIADA